MVSLIIEPSPAPTRSQEQHRTLLLASASTLLVLTTFVTPLVTLGRTAAELDAGPSAQAWLLSSMSVGLAVALLTSGALGDDHGRRKVFLLGLGVLAAGAAVCALAQDPLTFIGGRVLEGLGGAAVIACALGLIGHAFPPGPQRLHATGIWGASIGAGTGLGGVLTLAIDHGDAWRGAYWLTAVLSLLLVVAGRAWLVESRASVRRAPDLLGAALLGLGLAAVLAGLVEAKKGLSPSTLALLVGGVALVVAFTVAETRVASPMLDLALFRRPQFNATTIAALFTGIGLIGLCSFMPTMLQAGLGDGLLPPTLLMLVWAGSSAVVAWHVKRLPERFSGRARLATALLVIALGTLTLTGLDPETSTWRLVPGMLVTGVAYGLANATLGREAVASVPVDRVGMGSGANNTARYVGSALGVSLVVVTATHHGRTPAALVDGWNTAVLISAALSVLGALLVLACRPRAARWGA